METTNVHRDVIEQILSLSDCQVASRSSLVAGRSSSRSVRTGHVIASSAAVSGMWVVIATAPRWRARDDEDDQGAADTGCQPTLCRLVDAHSLCRSARNRKGDFPARRVWATVYSFATASGALASLGGRGGVFVQ